MMIRSSLSVVHILSHKRRLDLIMLSYYCRMFFILPHHKINYSHILIIIVTVGLKFVLCLICIVCTHMSQCVCVCKCA